MAASAAFALFSASAAVAVALGAQPTQARSRTDDTDWQSYNHRLSGSRYSELAQINVANVDRLTEVCRVELAQSGSLSSGPVLAAGTVYVTMNNRTVALNPATCAIRWKSEYIPDEPVVVPNNRGVAYLLGRVFRGTGDGRLLAYDATTGQLLWKRKISEPSWGEFVSAAPIAWRNTVFIGLSGGELGVRGKMMAFDARSGTRRWSFDLIPGAGQFGADTWAGESWKHGGGATWSSYALDEDTGELFVSVDNPAPAFHGAVRGGDNLYTNSLVCLDANTGQRLWHVQLRSHDTRDYGASAPAVLFREAGKRWVAQGSKDGFLYVIDRVRHRIAFRTAVTTVDPPALEHAAANPDAKVCPGISGGFLYNSPSFDVLNNSLISGTVDWCSIIHADLTPPLYVRGHEYAGGSQEHVGPGTGWITSVDAHDGHLIWRFATPAPVFAAVTSTAGGVTFTGDHDGNLYALQSSNGTLLWQLKTAASIAGGLITYQIDSKQYLAVESGNATLSPGSATGSPMMIVFSLH